MEKDFSILIVEDEQDICCELIECIEQKENAIVVGAINNAAKAIEYIRDYLPDAIILDLELHMGGGNGIQLLQEMHDMALNKPPYVLITTNNSSVTTYEFARELGADFIMYKHQKNYSVSGVVDFLMSMRNVIQRRAPRQKATLSNNIPPILQKKRIIERIHTELNLVNISPKTLGYQYLTEAILIVMDEPIPNLCAIIAEKHNKTEGSVERAMQNAINRAWLSADIDNLLTHYTARIKTAKGSPTLTDFIYYYARKLENEYK